MKLSRPEAGPRPGALTNEIPRIFDHPQVDEERLREIGAKADPRKRYLIAMTPRSGSSYLCDTIKRTRCLGRPTEALNEQLIPRILRKAPGRTPDEYLRNVLRARMSNNRISGMKASWFQFENFTAAMSSTGSLPVFHYVYLTRRDLTAQAVSLYRATSSSVFHTNVGHSEEALGKLAALDYSYDAIREWRDHIAAQERGWQRYFLQNRIIPLCITYEEIEENVLEVMKRIAAFIGIAPRQIEMPGTPSVFQKIGDARSLEWARRFEWERDVGTARPLSARAASPRHGRRATDG